jgi:hypothetical protein
MGKKGGGGNQSKQQDAGKSRGSSATVKGKSSKIIASRAKGLFSGLGQPKKQNASEAGEISVAASASRSKPPRNTRANDRESSHSPVAVSASPSKAPRSTQQQPGAGLEPKNLTATDTSERPVVGSTGEPTDLPSAGEQTGEVGQHDEIVATFSIDSFEVISSAKPMWSISGDVVSELKSLYLR